MSSSIPYLGHQLDILPVIRPYYILGSFNFRYNRDMFHVNVTTDKKKKTQNEVMMANHTNMTLGLLP